MTNSVANNNKRQHSSTGQENNCGPTEGVLVEMAVQTPKQRLANEKFARKNEKHRKFGKKKTKTTSENGFTVSRPWLLLLAFLIVGGGIIELVSYLL